LRDSAGISPDFAPTVRTQPYTFVVDDADVVDDAEPPPSAVDGHTLGMWRSTLRLRAPCTRTARVAPTRAAARRGQRGPVDRSEPWWPVTRLGMFDAE
jgi:hypothetical protein